MEGLGVGKKGKGGRRDKVGKKREGFSMGKEGRGKG